jgi:hypothetical protein
MQTLIMIALWPRSIPYSTIFFENLSVRININVKLGEVGWGDVDWIDLAQDRNRWRALVNSVLNLRVP